MKISKNPQDFTSHSLALLKASPTTTKITTSYHAAAPGKGTLTLKTYDPVSGALIKFRTNKIADVGRLIASLNRLAREQARVPEPVPVLEPTPPTVDAMTLDSPAAVGTPARGSTPIPSGAAAAVAGAVLIETAPRGGKGKKKKGKR